MPVANIAFATVSVCHRFEVLNRRNDLSLGRVLRNEIIGDWESESEAKCNHETMMSVGFLTVEIQLGMRLLPTLW